MQMWELPGKARPSEIVVFNEHSYSNVEASTQIHDPKSDERDYHDPALERLAELVRQAEAKTRARKIEGETQQAADQFRSTELAARQAVERLRTVRPASLRAIEQAIQMSICSKIWRESLRNPSPHWNRRPTRNS